ncbi:hypothetical protein [Gordonia sp. i37]|uniref:hypothetical protein n=1 Tax=Gordonia sp. i37 TaxID=1961707 RepID=UPI00209A799B|nr:hypothetical protein [Gordonia sp. i37]
MGRSPTSRRCAAHCDAAAYLYVVGLAGGLDAPPAGAVLDATAPGATGGELPNYAASAAAVRI